MEWLSAREAGRRLGINYQTALPVVARASGMRTRVIPGLPPKYHAGDVDALAARAVVGAGVESPAAPARPETRRTRAGAVR